MPIISEEIVEAANIAISNLLPTKSRSLYDVAYNRLKKWCAEKNVQNVLLAYFSENVKNYKSSTLWAQYSMVKSCLIIYDNIDISKFPKLIAFLKRTGDGYQAKKSDSASTDVVVCIFLLLEIKKEQCTPFGIYAAPSAMPTGRHISQKVCIVPSYFKKREYTLEYTSCIFLLLERRNKNIQLWGPITRKLEVADNFKLQIRIQEAKIPNIEFYQKSKILTKSEIDRFLSSADDKEFLMIKVGLILGIAGACRTDELVNLTVDDIVDVGSSLIVKIPNTKTKIPRIFVVTDVGNMLELFRKYLSLRPPHVKHKRLFLYYKAGKCSSQSVGKNTMGKIPSVVASYLKLPDVACYTGHCLRRSSATLLADAGVDITTIKRHAGWKSTTVAEGYVENSIENKTKIANQVLV
ncbi:hypothetical protein NQ317_010948 [Molorchus minor]|uniref:Tyr recombinase domain-containing protein n=1 Tax=Molorchus minor TaxID=1323400 RepID=A0ABQ9JLU3_9CUCU|nr:hypothetical protein NQ317_010948 [Molorchus minor]